MATAAHEEQPAFDAPDGFALRIKYQKHVLCVPVYPKTTYDNLAELCLDLLSDAGLSAPLETGTGSFTDLTTTDLAFFEGSHATAGGATASSRSDEVRFIELDRSKKGTIDAMGLKDGSDAVLYLGFRNKSSGTFSKPDVVIAPITDEDMDELDDVAEGGKGKGRA